jgi:hypothetical protein
VVGEFLDDPGQRTYHAPGLFVDERTPIRRVRWFNPVDELRVPAELSDTLRIPVPISQLPQTFYKAIFETTYGTFYRAGDFSAGVRILGDDFDTQSNLDLGRVLKWDACPESERQQCRGNRLREIRQTIPARRFLRFLGGRFGRLTDAPLRAA